MAEEKRFELKSKYKPTGDQPQAISELLEGLIGGKDYRSAIQLILSTPDEYASNKFALECFNSPETLGAKSKDPQNMIISQLLKPGDLVVDYGVGKGRFFEGLGIDYAKEWEDFDFLMNMLVELEKNKVSLKSSFSH